jgi:hypothetical protein
MICEGASGTRPVWRITGERSGIAGELSGTTDEVSDITDEL